MCEEVRGEMERFWRKRKERGKGEKVRTFLEEEEENEVMEGKSCDEDMGSLLKTHLGDGCEVVSRKKRSRIPEKKGTFFPYKSGYLSFFGSGSEKRQEGEKKEEGMNGKKKDQFFNMEQRSFKEEGFCSSEQRRVDHAKYLLQFILPELKEMNRVQMLEREFEARLQGLSLGELEIQHVECLCLYCDNCGTSIFDYHRSCSRCCVNLCLLCCLEIRGENQQGSPQARVMDYGGGMVCFSQGTKEKMDESCSKVGLRSSARLKLRWKASEEGKIICGCGLGCIELRCLLPENEVSELVKKAEEITKRHELDKAKIHVEKCGCSNSDSVGNCLYCPRAKDIGEKDLKHFQCHWMRGEPVLVTNVLETAAGFGLKSTNMFYEALPKISHQRHDKHLEVKATDFSKWPEVDMDAQRGVKGHFNGWFGKHQPPSDEHFSNHDSQIFSCFPFKEYFDPLDGPFNLASMCNGIALRPSFRPMLHKASVFCEEAGYGDSKIKFQYNISDNVNVMVHTDQKVTMPQQLIQWLTELDERGFGEINRVLMQKINGCTPGHRRDDLPMCARKSPGEEETQMKDSCFNVHALSKKPEQKCCKEVNSCQPECIESNEVESEVATTAEEGAIWDIFRRGDIPKLKEYIKNKVKGFTGIHSFPLEKAAHPIYHQTFYLTAKHKRKLKAVYGIEPWTIIQKNGDAVFVPAGCPYQVRYLKPCIHVAFNFISPENLGECIRLTEELRLLPIDHGAKMNVLELKKNALLAAKWCVEVLENVLQDYSQTGGTKSSSLTGNEVNNTLHETRQSPVVGKRVESLLTRATKSPYIQPKATIVETISSPTAAASFVLAKPQEETDMMVCNAPSVDKEISLDSMCHPGKSSKILAQNVLSARIESLTLSQFHSDFPVGLTQVDNLRERKTQVSPPVFEVPSSVVDRVSDSMHREELGDAPNASKGNMHQVKSFSEIWVDAHKFIGLPTDISRNLSPETNKNVPASRDTNTVTEVSKERKENVIEMKQNSRVSGFLVAKEESELVDVEYMAWFDREMLQEVTKRDNINAFPSTAEASLSSKTVEQVNEGVTTPSCNNPETIEVPLLSPNTRILRASCKISDKYNLGTSMNLSHTSAKCSNLQVLSRRLLSQLSSRKKINDSMTSSDVLSSNVTPGKDFLEEKRGKLLGFLNLSLEAIHQGKLFDHIKRICMTLDQHTSDLKEKAVLEDLVKRLAEFKDTVPKALAMAEYARIPMEFLPREIKDLDMRLEQDKEQLSSLAAEFFMLQDEEAKIEAEIQRLTAEKNNVTLRKDSVGLILEKTNQETSQRLKEWTGLEKRCNQANESWVRAKETVALANGIWRLFRDKFKS